MKKVNFLFFLTLLACNFDQQCGNFLILNSDIFIYGWDKNDPTIKKAVIYEYSKNEKKTELNSYFLKDIINPYSVNNGDELRLRTSGILKTKNNYKLILNDSLVFEISDFEIDNVNRGTAITIQKYCLLKKYKVNNNVINQKNNHLQFDKTLGKEK